MAQASGRKLDELYRLAWKRGLKTTYYLRTLAATSAEKSTGRGGELNSVSVDGGVGQFTSRANMETTDYTPATDAKFCSIDNPECESCQ
jgi:ribonucleoside-diphosphate reductase alpha chain